MANFYFTTGSNPQTPHLSIRVLSTGRNYFYSLPLSSIKFSYLIDSTDLLSTDDTSRVLYLHDLYKENVEIIMDASVDNVYINGVITTPSPVNSYGLYNEFTSSNYI